MKAITQFRRKVLLVAMAAGMTLAAGVSVAQTANTTGCTPQEKSAQQQLGKTQGVICPPDVDPGMKKPTPQTGGAMPVVPPPGTPGGNPNVQPK
jgi:hypothetical protein